MKLKELKEKKKFIAEDMWSECVRDADGFFTDPEDVENWLQVHARDENGSNLGTAVKYLIDIDGSVDVQGGILFKGKSFTRLPIRFTRLDNVEFKDHKASLESLVGLPKRMSGFVMAHNCGLKSLEGSPEMVGKTFNVASNKLTTLEGAPKSVATVDTHSSFDCSQNKLRNLIGGPTQVDGFYGCAMNDLVSLEGAPVVVKSFYGYKNPNIKSLKHAPKICHGSFTIDGNLITSLENITDIFVSIGEDFTLSSWDQITTGGLGLLNIERLKNITKLDHETGVVDKDLPAPFKIISQYIGHPDKIFECQSELIDNGFEAFSNL